MTAQLATKILHIVEDLKVGGLEKILASIVLSLDKSKYDAQVWCLAQGGDIAQELVEKGMTVRILQMKSYHNPLNIVRLALIIKRERFQLIHAHGYFAGTFGRLVAILARIPVIIAHVHSTYYNYGKRHLLMERFLSCFTDRIICISQAVQRFVTINEGIRSEKTSLIYNAVAPSGSLLNDDSRNELRRSLGFESDAIVIAVVASLTANKGHDILFAAFQEVFRGRPSTRLLIIGDGPLREQLETAVRQLSIDQAVVFTGIRQDIFRLLQTADIFVLPSRDREGLGIAIIEAMATGLPVVGTDLGGIPEVIEDGENGFLVSPGNSGQLAEALKKLIDDREMRKDMGYRGRKRFEEKFTLQRMIRQIEELYDYLLEKKGIDARA